MELFAFPTTTAQVIQTLLTKPNIRFLVDKCNITAKEIPHAEIAQNQLGQKAFEIAKTSKGKYVTTTDVFAAFLVLTESQTKLFIKKELKPEVFLKIGYWKRADYPQEEEPKTHKILFLGQGIGEDWVTGWTFETKKYITDFTAYTLRTKPLLNGQKKEYESLVEMLCKSGKNSVIITGEPGVGKTSMVQHLATDSSLGQLHGALYHKRFFQLMVGPLLAGANDQGTLETRLQSILEELTHSVNIILFIPEIENVVGTTSYHLDLTGALLPYLREGNLQVIATTTKGAYKQFIEPMQTFTDVFEVINLEEPNRDEAVQMLLEKVHEIEWKNHVSFTYRAVVTGVDLANRYMHDKALPGAAVGLLTYVASSGAYKQKNVIDENDVITKVEERTHIAVATPKPAEKELLLHLEDKLHERIIDQEEAIKEISQAVRRFRAGLSVGIRPISFLFLGPTGVGKTETAKALAALYFGGEEQMIRLDMSEYATADSERRLLGAPAGEGIEKGELTEKIHEHPYSLVLLDEFEKAYPAILDLFLQVLDDGRLTDNKGKTVSFASSIIIATSNAGSEFIREHIAKGTKIDKTFQQGILELLQSKGIFRPELLNRFDGIVVFKPITPEQAVQITKLLLKSFAKKLQEQDITIIFDEKLAAKVAKEGLDIEFGARPLRRFIQANIEDFIAQKMLKDEIKRGDKITLSTDENGNIVIVP